MIVHSYHLQLRAWATLAGWPSSYRYWLCSLPLTALLLQYPCKIVDLLRLHDGYKDSLQISVIAVLSYTGDLFFPLLSVYASCSSSIRYNILCFYKLSLIAMSLAAWVTQAQILRKCFKLLLSSFPLCFWGVCLKWNTKHTKLQRCKNECWCWWWQTLITSSGQRASKK